MPDRVSLETVRNVWELLTTNPRRKFSDFGYAQSTVSKAVKVLVKTGYIEHNPGEVNAIKIVVPFYCVPVRSIKNAD